MSTPCTAVFGHIFKTSSTGGPVSAAIYWRRVTPLGGVLRLELRRTAAVVAEPASDSRVLRGVVLRLHEMSCHNNKVERILGGHIFSHGEV